MDLIVSRNNILSVRLHPTILRFPPFDRKDGPFVAKEYQVEDLDEAYRQWYGSYTKEWVGRRFVIQDYLLDMKLAHPIFKKDNDSFKIIGWNFYRNVQILDDKYELLHAKTVEKIVEQTIAVGYPRPLIGASIYTLTFYQKPFLYSYQSGNVKGFHQTFKLESAWKDDFDFETDLDSLIISS